LKICPGSTRKHQVPEPRGWATNTGLGRWGWWGSRGSIG
jgi:hypothetical protein